MAISGIPVRSQNWIVQTSPMTSKNIASRGHRNARIEADTFKAHCLGNFARTPGFEEFGAAAESPCTQAVY
jgi:hypothetical protein